MEKNFSAVFFNDNNSVKRVASHISFHSYLLKIYYLRKENNNLSSTISLSLHSAHEKDLESMKNFKNEDTKTNLKNRKHLQPRWTDTGSVSSGVSSDFSSYDTDAECCSREGIEQDEVNTTDEELHDEFDDKHYVQNEVNSVIFQTRKIPI